MSKPLSPYAPGKHPNSLAVLEKNRQPWTGGRTGKSVKGRPPDITALLAKVLGEQKDNMTAAEALLRVLRRRALEGDVKAAGMLLDRAYGLPKQTIGLVNETAVVNFHDAE